MSSVEQDPINEAEEFRPKDEPTAEEHQALTETDPLTAEATEADIAAQRKEVPLPEENAPQGEQGADEQPEVGEPTA